MQSFTASENRWRKITFPCNEHSEVESNDFLTKEQNIVM